MAFLLAAAPLTGLGYHFAGEITLAFRPGLRFWCYEKGVRR